MIAEKPYILYSLPNQRPCQSLKARKIEKAISKVDSFLSAMNHSLIEDAKTSELIAIEPFYEDEPKAFYSDQIINLNNKFGKGKTSSMGFMYPSGKPRKQKKTEWSINNGQLQMAFDYLINQQPWPKLSMPALELVVSYNIELKDFPTKKVLPDQQYNSSLMVWFSQNSQCNLTLAFPFSEPNKRFWKYFNQTNEISPVLLEKKHLRLVRANRKRTRNAISKLKETDANTGQNSN